MPDCARAFAVTIACALVTTTTYAQGSNEPQLDAGTIDAVAEPPSAAAPSDGDAPSVESAGDDVQALPPVPPPPPPPPPSLIPTPTTGRLHLATPLTPRAPPPNGNEWAEAGVGFALNMVGLGGPLLAMTMMDIASPEIMIGVAMVGGLAVAGGVTLGGVATGGRGDFLAAYAGTLVGEIAALVNVFVSAMISRCNHVECGSEAAFIALSAAGAIVLPVVGGVIGYSMTDVDPDAPPPPREEARPVDTPEESRVRTTYTTGSPRFR